MRTFFLSLGFIVATGIALPALAAEQEHDAAELKRVNVTAINAETRVVFWDKDTVKIEVFIRWAYCGPVGVVAVIVQAVTDLRSTRVDRSLRVIAITKTFGDGIEVVI